MDTVGARTRAPALLGGMLLPLLLAAAGPAAAAAITSCGALITAPGTYVLANDLDCTSSAAPPVAIRIRANDVHLVLGGHTITGGPTSAVGVIAAPAITSPPLTGVKIQGGAVTGFNFGIQVLRGAGAHVSGVTVSGNLSVGIFLLNCPGCRVTGSRASGTRDFGIDLAQNVLGAQISGNTVTGSGNIGIYATSGAVGVRLTGNAATGNGLDLRDDNPGTAGGCPNTWNGNTFDTTGGAGAACIQ